jgi:hypothetical protein
MLTAQHIVTYRHSQVTAESHPVTEASLHADLDSTLPRPATTLDLLILRAPCTLRVEKRRVAE